LKLKIENNKLYLEDIEDVSLGNKFIYKYPNQYQDYYTGRQVTRYIDRIPFQPVDGDDSKWEFPTPQWIYPLMKLLNENNLSIDNPKILDTFKNPGGLLKNKYHLWDNQVKCLEKVTSFKHGISILRTGAGKTTMISVLAKNMLDAGKKVLVMAPTNGVLHEIRDRFIKDFKIDCKYYFDDTKKIHFINPRGMFRSNKFWLHDPYWQDVDCIIFDEVENCMNDLFLRVLDRIPPPEFMYGFSGTANKVTGGKLEFTPGGQHPDNQLNLISYLGWTSWYEKPKDRKVNFVRITPSLKLGKLTKEEIDDAFNKVVIKLAGNKDYHKLIKNLFDGGYVKNLFIPFVSRVAIDEFLKHTPYKVGLITGSGFQKVMTPQGKPEKCTLKDIKDLAKNNKIQLIIGSRSAFAGIDFPPNWDSSLANAIGNLANSSVQAAGRVSRASEFNMFWFTCRGNVPVFNNQVRSAVKLMKKYYSESETTDSTIIFNHLK
jgi:hypothetical protein